MYCINNLTNNQAESAQYTALYLTFSVWGDGTEWIDYGLPTPHYMHHHRVCHKYVIAWAVAGYFATPKSRGFLLDVVARLLLAFPGAERLPWAPEQRETGHRLDAPPYELKELASRLPSLPWDHRDTHLASLFDEAARELTAKREARRKPGEDPNKISEDALFEAARWHLYRRAYAEGHTRNITEDYVRVLLETENQLMTKPRDPSDVRAKAKRMAEYMQNEFVIYQTAGYADWSREQKNAYMREYRHRKGINMATREEHAMKLNEKRREESRRKVLGLLTGMFAEEYKRAGKWNISKIAKDLRMGRNTVAWIIHEWETDKK